MTHNGGLVEVLTTGDGTTWSIIITTPQGMSCLVAAGEGWRTMEAKSPDPEAMAEHVPLILAHGEASWIMEDPATDIAAASMTAARCASTAARWRS